MFLKWECLNDDFAHRAKAPLFGHIRVERYSTDSEWGVNWSAPGICDTLIEGGWPSAEDAKTAAEAFVSDAFNQLSS
jgi:hypothetical protein